MLFIFKINIGGPTHDGLFERPPEPGEGGNEGVEDYEDKQNHEVDDPVLLDVSPLRVEDVELEAAQSQIKEGQQEILNELTDLSGDQDASLRDPASQYAAEDDGLEVHDDKEHKEFVRGDIGGVAFEQGEDVLNEGCRKEHDQNGRLLSQDETHLRGELAHIHDLQGARHVDLCLSRHLEVDEANQADVGEREDPEVEGKGVEIFGSKILIKVAPLVRESADRRQEGHAVQEREKKLGHCDLPVSLLEEVVLPDKGADLGPEGHKPRRRKDGFRRR